MEFKIEDYSIFISQYTETLVEIDILRNEMPVCISATVSVLNISELIKKTIKKNEMKEFGYVRFTL